MDVESLDDLAKIQKGTGCRMVINFEKGPDWDADITIYDDYME